MILKIDTFHEALSSRKSTIQIDRLNAITSDVVKDVDGSVDNIDADFGKIQRFFGKVSARTRKEIGKILHLPTVLDAVKYMVGQGMSPEAFLNFFVEQASQAKERVNNDPEAALKSVKPFAVKHHELLVRRMYLNWLSLAGLYPQVDYNELHTKGIYLFTNNDIPTNFAVETTGYTNGAEHTLKIIGGRKVLTLGAGNGRDEKEFVRAGADEVMMIEGSQYMLKKLKKTKESIPEESREKFVMPHNATDMFAALEEMIQQGTKVDTIYSHSTLHYFDKPTLIRLLTMILQCLNVGGHLAFGIKAPGASLDGNGIPLISVVGKIEDAKSPSTVRDAVRVRAFLNNDGQIRFFRGQPELKRLLENIQDGGFRFKPMRITENVVESYETHGQDQIFYYAFLRKEAVSETAPVIKV